MRLSHISTYTLMCSQIFITSTNINRRISRWVLLLEFLLTSTKFIKHLKFVEHLALELHLMLPQYSVHDGHELVQLRLVQLELDLLSLINKFDHVYLIYFNSNILCVHWLKFETLNLTPWCIIIRTEVTLMVIPSFEEVFNCDVKLLLFFAWSSRKVIMFLGD